SIDSTIVSPSVNTYWIAIGSGSSSSDQPIGRRQATMNTSNSGSASRKFTSAALTDTVGRIWGGNGTRLMSDPLSTTALAPDSIDDENQIQGSNPAKTKMGYAGMSTRM